MRGCFSINRSIDRFLAPVCFTFRFIAIKLPEKAGEGNYYYYMDDSNPSWKFGTSTLDQPSNGIYYTLQQVYKRSSVSNFMFSFLTLILMYQMLLYIILKYVK